MNWNLSPARYSVSPGATLRRANISPSRRSMSLPFRPQGRQRSLRWQVEQSVLSVATDVARGVAGTGAMRKVRTGASAVAVDMVEASGGRSGRNGSGRNRMRYGADGRGELVELGGLVQETGGARAEIALAVGRPRVVGEDDE